MNGQFDPTNEFECFNISLDDELLSKAKIAAYMYDQQFQNSEGKEKPFTPKAFPGKAIAIVVPLGDGKSTACIYLDANEFVWDSKVIIDNDFGKFSPDQMEQFFNSQFYSKMIESLQKKWPLTDPNYAKLFQAVADKNLRVGVIPEDEIEEMKSLGSKIDEIEHSHDINQPGKRKDLANKDTTGDGRRDYTGSGRKIVNFSDMGVNSKSAEYYCWPRKGKEFKWNSWKEWKKQKPFCKMTFKHNGRRYMISMSLFDEDFDNRGFRGGDTEWLPPFAWLTPGECQQIMKLSIVRKFLKQCTKRIKKYLSMTPEEVLSKIDKPERVDLKEIEKTQRVIKHATKIAFGNAQADSYCYKK